MTVAYAWVVSVPSILVTSLRICDAVTSALAALTAEDASWYAEPTACVAWSNTDSKKSPTGEGVTRCQPDSAWDEREDTYVRARERARGRR